jgi:YcaO-like protein with predicted kinase domain
MTSSAVASMLDAVEETSKRFLHGTARVTSPTDTLSRVRPHLDQLGVTRIANLTGLDRIGIPVVAAIRPNARSLSVSQGKGVTLDAAKASAVMEALELHHAEHIHVGLLYGSARELRRHALVDTQRLPSVRRSRFREDLPILWIEGHELRTRSARWVPFEMVHASARVPAPAGSGCFSATSNGLASGNHLAEATVHALCEVIERDATALWEVSGGRRRRTRLDLSTVDDGHCRYLLAEIAAAGVDVAVWSTTSDCGVASFICEIVDVAADGELPMSSFTGMGCHPTRAIALSRAVTEAVQCRLTYIAGSRDDLFRREYSPTWGASVPRPLYASLREHPSALAFQDVPDFSAPTVLGDLQWILGRLEVAGCDQVVVVDLTKPEYGIPVVRVIVPGLEGPDDDPNYVAGERALRMQREVECQTQ